MAYYEVGLLSRDMDFHLRVSACYGVETRAADPETWALQHMWQIASAPGFGDQYAYALNTHPDDPDYQPGKDPGVITDGQILAAVQQLIANEPPA